MEKYVGPVEAKVKVKANLNVYLPQKHMLWAKRIEKNRHHESEEKIQIQIDAARQKT